MSGPNRPTENLQNLHKERHVTRSGTVTDVAKCHQDAERPHFHIHGWVKVQPSAESNESNSQVEVKSPQMSATVRSEVTHIWSTHKDPQSTEGSLRALANTFQNKETKIEIKPKKNKCYS